MNNNVSILYIHGFNSSPLSVKAEQTKQYFNEHFPDIGFVCPQLKNSPQEAISQLQSIVDEYPDTQWLFMGSSLGGYFSTYLATKYNAPAVLINPAVKPFELLQDFIGEQTNPYTHEVYQVLPQHMEQLRSLFIDAIEPSLFKVLVQTGDEVLDYRQAQKKYAKTDLLVEKGGDHSFVNYERQLPRIGQFFEQKLSLRVAQA
ncbi:YqiA/YcfP family alpha/beta fold hydrolase [Thalassotalea agarivorans]|uniref:Esterase YqiA n=1 Tax=Thalassotalea agarivorans TaxID=349064 RepID=A0A1I0HSB6_THASX|nr:YqiA/YcfP family alpha/beta fold hydrolase [Thalassotalea agarivorans]SET87080.1 hypothetical protein SAMN05660429_02912 [Thalassotalea agarivorans]